MGIVMIDQPENPTDAERRIFLESLEFEVPEQRAAFLDRACASTPGIRAAVEALLRHHKEDQFMQPFTLKTAPFSALEKPGDRIGRYKLLQQIGEGGYGVVYMAEQEEPVRRQVALKVIKLGMDTRNFIARFEAERQALALMDHPNIAKVFDAGATDTGRPYFVMELVRGIRITEFCDQNNLSTHERLKLFMQVCQAIQHAHQKGIIHRDIKPSNILVTLRDGVPVPKVIDFGIAKATQERLTDKTLFTAFHQFIGTPAYMSPEQAEMSELGVDTRSDIYSLGVLLYELLTGRTPFDSKTLLQSGLDEVRRVIREQDPVRPSTRLSTLAAADLTVAARQRCADPGKLSALVRGDLDWIVMKALEKDRTRRYATALGLALDVQRYLADEPVQARPPSNIYRFQKFVRRNKLAFVAASVANAALIIALIVALMAVVRIKVARSDATEKLRRSYLSEARATRTSALPGQRFSSLETVQKAAAIRPDLEARNEAIACLAAPDLRVAKQAVVTGHAHNEHACFELNLERYAFQEENGDTTIRAASNDVVIAVLPAADHIPEGIITFSADGKYLKARYWREHEGDSGWVWNLKNQNVVIRALHERDDSHAIQFPFADEFSRDSRLFASGSREGNISIYETASGELIKQFHAARPFSHLVFGPGDRRLACSTREDPGVEIRDAESGRVLITINCPTGVSAVNWSDDGTRLVTACMNNTIYVWDAESGRQTAVLEGDTAFIMSVAFNHAGDLVASAGYDDIVQLWNPDSGRKVAGFRGSSWQLEFSADDRQLSGWQNGYRYGSLEVASGRECRQLFVQRDGSFTSVPAFSPDGRILAAGTEFKTRFWDAFSGKEIGSISNKHADDIVFDPDGRSFITVDRGDGVHQRTFERVGGQSSSTYRLGKPRLFYEGVMEAASFSFDGRYFAVTEQLKGKAYIFDMQNPLKKVILAPQPMVNRIAISPDGRWAATASWHNSLLDIWDAHTGDLLHTVSMPDSDLRHLQSGWPLAGDELGRLPALGSRDLAAERPARTRHRRTGGKFYRLQSGQPGDGEISRAQNRTIGDCNEKDPGNVGLAGIKLRVKISVQPRWHAIGGDAVRPAGAPMGLEVGSRRNGPNGLGLGFAALSGRHSMDCCRACRAGSGIGTRLPVRPRGKKRFGIALISIFIASLRFAAKSFADFATQLRLLEW